MKVFKIYGLERSGTNFIKYVLETNFKNTLVLSNMYGHKHSNYEPHAPDYDPDQDKNVIHDFSPEEMQIIKQAFINNEVNYILIYKSLPMWLISYAKYKKYVDITPELINQWTARRDQFHESIIKGIPSNLTILHYEWSMLQGKGLIDFLMREFHLPVKPARYILPSNNLLRGTDEKSCKYISNDPFDIYAFLLKMRQARKMRRFWGLNELSEIEKQLKEKTVYE